MDKENVIHTHTHTHRNIIQLLKKEILPLITTWVKLKGAKFEVSQIEKDKYCIISLICGI